MAENRTSSSARPRDQRPASRQVRIVPVVDTQNIPFKTALKGFQPVVRAGQMPGYNKENKSSAGMVPKTRPRTGRMRRESSRMRAKSASLYLASWDRPYHRITPSLPGPRASRDMRPMLERDESRCESVLNGREAFPRNTLTRFNQMHAHAENPGG
jgi:hypothetical protein